MAGEELRAADKDQRVLDQLDRLQSGPGPFSISNSRIDPVPRESRKLIFHPETEMGLA